MIDVYIAAKANIFVGNGLSNTSQIVRYLKKWSDKDIHFIGPEVNLQINHLSHQSRRIQQAPHLSNYGIILASL